MQTKYDSYYEKNIPYKMTLEEMMSQKYIKKEHLLAYIRNQGTKNFYFSFVPVGYSNYTEKERIVMLEDERDYLNPLIENHSRKNSWYNAHKFKLKSLDSQYEHEWYISDFMSFFNDGYIDIIERNWKE